VKLQDAYVAETNALGIWKTIGYAAPGGTNFTYAGGETEAQNKCPTGYTASTAEGRSPCFKEVDGKAQTVAAESSSITDGWTAQNNVKLNDCPAQVNWKISATTGDAATNTGSVTYTPSIVDETNCAGLTPHFTKIGQ
jgi:hypothetical protein